MSIKNEAQFRESFFLFLKKYLKDYLKDPRDMKHLEIREKENLLYTVKVLPDLTFFPPLASNFRRGNIAFETDISIGRKVQNGFLPIVVIELKFGGLSTHDVITYSYKSVKHKDIYPYLRYGLIIGKISSLPRRFFNHNFGFDFAIALDSKDIQSIENLEITRDLDEMLKILGRQIYYAIDSVNLFSRRQSNVKIFENQQVIR